MAKCFVCNKKIGPMDGLSRIYYKVVVNTNEAPVEDNFSGFICPKHNHANEERVQSIKKSYEEKGYKVNIIKDKEK